MVVRRSRRWFVQSAAVLAAATVMARRGKAQAKHKPGPKHFVLVHGSWHGAWCWYKTVTLLAADGHKVTALDLPSHGIDGTPPGTVTLDDYTDRVIAALEAIDGPVILVGHSMGGAVIQLAAEAWPEKIEKLVFLTAFLVKSGTSLLEASSADPESLAAANLIVKPDEGVVDVDRAAIVPVFYAKSPTEDVNLARVLLKPNPLAPVVTPLALSDANFGSVRRFYISCTEDQAITPAAQQAMYTATPCEAVYKLHTDHSPFFSAPKQLNKVLDDIAGA